MRPGRDTRKKTAQKNTRLTSSCYWQWTGRRQLYRRPPLWCHPCQDCGDIGRTAPKPVRHADRQSDRWFGFGSRDCLPGAARAKTSKILVNCARACQTCKRTVRHPNCAKACQTCRRTVRQPYCARACQICRGCRDIGHPDCARACQTYRQTVRLSRCARACQTCRETVRQSDRQAHRTTALQRNR